MRVKKSGFTIVEMLMVIAVLAVLTGIVATAATSVIRKSRVRKNEALRAALQAGIATYCQQEGFWPPGESGTLQNWADDGLDAKYRNKGVNVAPLSESDYDALMNYIVTRCLNASGNPVMDVSGFTATRRSATSKRDDDKYDPYQGNPLCYGEDIRSWVAKLKASNSRSSTPNASEMVFGYSNSEKGYFRRFVIYYNSEADSVTVGYSKKESPKNSGNWVDDK